MMLIFKCKMCGGDLEICDGASVAECQYCGTKQTLPKLDDERRAKLYDRANHFRRNNEFDKAASIYERILNEDSTDAESYWSLVLCRYGIEYVDDPGTHRRVPTVNRAQYTSIFDDDNYKSALQYADDAQRTVYKAEAMAINDIQKGILEISSKEEPFDVFICYKETDNNGRRTYDSVLANDLYHQLTQEGFKVFFARITLEDKLGNAYEPYIFAALNSAKVMVVLGTKPEYFNAVWVKNEWSRYLALVKKSGGKKTLIPAYKDMDPYDLPEEFSHLQAQDMSNLGFMQDLIRGIKKIAQADTPKTTVVKETVVASGNANTVPLLKRAFMFLEDGDFARADEFCEQVLNQDPENASAYLGKLLSELKVRKQDSLIDQTEPFDGNNNYQKAMRFADKDLANQLKGYIDFINERNEKNRLNNIYNNAVETMQSASTEEEYKKTANAFKSIPGFKDADELALRCENMAKQVVYEDACKKEKLGSVAHLQNAHKLFCSISGYKDADERVIVCKQKIAEIEAKKIAAEKAAEEERRKEKEKKKKFIKITATIGIPCLALATAFIIILNMVIIPNSNYDAAIALMDAGKYTEAISVFKALNGFRDSIDKINECKIGVNDSKYSEAIALMDAGNIVEAYETLRSLDGYKDSTDKANSIYGKYTLEKLKSAKVGDYVFFGKYEQDSNTSNGKENVEWLVLEVKDGKTLVISKYALDCKQYNTSRTNVTWETCSLRKWLNGAFINSAFSADERARISSVTVSADKNHMFGTNPGNATKDQVFLLSSGEANKYFDTSAMQCKPTDFAVTNGAYVNSENGNCWWWLRSPGGYRDYATYVLNVGGINECGYDVSNSDFAVRPALWIDLNS